MNLVKDWAKKDFGRRLKKAIAESEFKQYQIAAIVGVEPPNVSRWCTGKHYPDPEHFTKLCEILHLEESYFLEKQTMSGLAKSSDSGLDNRALRDRIRKLEQMIEGIPEPYLEALLDAGPARLRAFEALFGLEEQLEQEDKATS